LDLSFGRYKGDILFGCSGRDSRFIDVGTGSGENGDIPPVVNQSPIATIDSPTNTFFNEGENIVFSGVRKLL
jgi:hypothetical protein